MRKFQCTMCGHVYDEALGDPAQGIAPGTLWEDVPDEYCCPECSAIKADYEPMEVI